MPNSPQPPRRKRLQFSLRTLMVAVLLYGGAWLLTIKWGANQLAGEMALKRASLFRKDFVLNKTKDGQIVLDGKVLSMKSYVPLKITFSARCPFPFILLYSEHWIIHGIYNEEIPWDKYSNDFVWFFGYATEELAPKGDKPYNQIVGDDEVIEANPK